MTGPDDRIRYTGSYRPGPEPEHELPTSGAGQSCAFCGSWTVAWLHPLDPDQVQYRFHGKGHTLPWFWTTCGVCESAVAAGDDTALVQVMSGGWADHDEDDLRQVLGVFRRADRGPRPLTP